MASSSREALTFFSAVVVTGGSSGIGKSLIGTAVRLNPALRFCNLSRSVPDLKITEPGLRHFPCDLSQPEEIVRAAKETVEHLNQVAPTGRLLLINNSGFGGVGRFPEPGLSHQLEMVDVNVRAVLQLTGLLLPELRRRGGAIINIASLAAYQPTPYLATYGATKAFLLNWSLALNEELRGSGVRTLAVCPGPTKTAFFQRAGIPPESAGPALQMSADAVAEGTYAALAAGRSVVVTGWFNRVVATAAAILPRRLVARIAARVLARHRLQRLAP